MTALSLPAVGTCLGLFPSVIKSGEPWTASCQAALDAANEELRKGAPLPALEDIERAIAHAINKNSLEGKLDMADFTAAALLGEDVLAHLAGATDAQVYERMSEEERLAAGLAAN